MQFMPLRHRSFELMLLILRLYKIFSIVFDAAVHLKLSHQAHCGKRALYISSSPPSFVPIRTRQVDSGIEPMIT